MSGPQGPDHTQPWSGQAPATGTPAAGPESEPPPEGSDDVTTQAPTFRPPAAAPPQPTHAPFDPPQHQQPGPPSAPGYPAPGGQAPPGYRPQPYQPVRPGTHSEAIPPPGRPMQGYPPPYSSAAQQYPSRSLDAPAQQGAYGPSAEHGAYWGPGGPYGTQSGSPAMPFRQKRSKALLLVGGGGLVVLVVAAVLILGLWKPGFFVTRQLDVAKAQADVQQILTDTNAGYGAANVTDVKCNAGTNPVVATGGTFTCDVTIGGAKHQVTATFQDDSGAYVVGQPK